MAEAEASWSDPIWYISTVEVWVESHPWIAGMCVVYVCMLVWNIFLNWNRKAPGPIPWPILGNTADVLINYHRRLEWLHSLRNRFGPHFTVQFPGLPRVTATTDPATIQHILRDNFGNYVKGYLFQQRLQELLGKGIFTADKELWATQRKTASHMFKASNIKSDMFNVFAAHAKGLAEVLRSGPGASGEVVDLQDLFYRYTLDSVGEIAFGINIDSLHLGDKVTFARSFDFVQATSERRFFHPMWRLGRWTTWSEWQLPKHIKTLNDFAHKVIRDRVKDGSASSRTDLLSRFMALDSTKLAKSGIVEKETLDFYRDVIMNFVIAGRDTTAQASTWSVYEVCRHPDVEAKLLKELDENLGGKPITFDKIAELPYTRNIFQEALRLHPSVPVDFKLVEKTDTLPCGVGVAGGDVLLYLPWVMGRDKTLWGEDAEEFRPERWETEPMPSQWKYPVFNAGRRTCLGKDMAMLEGCTVLATVFQNFKVVRPDKKPATYATSITLPMKGGLRVSVEPRSKK